MLKITVNRDRQILTIFLEGELDHHAVAKAKEKIDTHLMKTPVKQLIFDMSAVTFMDSSGIGLIVGRYNRIKILGGMMKIVNPSSNLFKILKMSGIGKLMEIG